MNNGRDCEHGRRVGNCDSCDLVQAEKRIAGLEAERDALSAQVQALQTEFKDARKTLQFIASCGHDSTDEEIADVVLAESRRWVSRYDDSCFKLAPSQHLAEIRAEAGRAGFVAGYSKGWNDFDDTHGFRRYQLADQYAAKVRQGGE